MPVAEGLKLTWKVVDPPAATLVAGFEVRLKSLALVPLRVGVFTANAASPLFWMVKVRMTGLPTSVEPKSVWSAVLGELSPSAMVVLLPCRLISGAIPLP